MLTRSSLTIRLHPADDVVIARQQLVGGTRLLDEDVTVVGLVPPVSWIENVRSSGPSVNACAPSSALIWFASQPSPMISTPAKFACFA